MNTIDYIANGQNVQFSKKSVTINGEEFAYTGMSAIKHSSAKCIYLFKYDGQWRMLNYNESDEQKLKTLFTRIADLNAKRAAILKAAEQAAAKAVPEAADKTASEAAEKAAPEIAGRIAPEIATAAGQSAEEVVDVKLIMDPAKEEPAGPLQKATETPVTKPFVTPEVEAAAMPEIQAVETPVEEMPVSIDTPEAAEALDKTDYSGYTPAAAVASDSNYSVESAVADAIGATAEGAAERTEAIPQEEKKAKMKKALIIFAAVIALFVILGVVYFFVAGTSNNPTVGPNADETQQYEDIDGLIKDLQEE